MVRVLVTTVDVSVLVVVDDIVDTVVRDVAICVGLLLGAGVVPNNGLEVGLMVVTTEQEPLKTSHREEGHKSNLDSKSEQGKVEVKV